jgi:hypothetical protein
MLTVKNNFGSKSSKDKYSVEPLHYPRHYPCKNTMGRSTKKRKAVPQPQKYIKIPNVIYCEGMRLEIHLNNENVFLHGIHFNRLLIRFNKV